MPHTFETHESAHKFLENFRVNNEAKFMELYDGNKDFQNADAEGVEFTCPVEAYWFEDEVYFTAEPRFAFMVPGLGIEEGYPSIKAAAQKAKEMFSQKYCGIKVAPIFYTVKNRPKLPIRGIAGISLFMLSQCNLSLFQTVKAVAVIVREWFQSEKPLTGKDLHLLETMVGKA